MEYVSPSGTAFLVDMARRTGRVGHGGLRVRVDVTHRIPSRQLPDGVGVSEGARGLAVSGV